jgi:hypothetical protein
VFTIKKDVEVIKWTLVMQEMGLDMITLPSHTSHDLEPLVVSCFKPFKTTFKKVKNVAMSKKNHMELDKITLNGW